MLEHKACPRAQKQDQLLGDVDQVSEERHVSRFVTIREHRHIRSSNSYEYLPVEVVSRGKRKEHLCLSWDARRHKQGHKSSELSVGCAGGCYHMGRPARGQFLPIQPLHDSPT